MEDEAKKIIRDVRARVLSIVQNIANKPSPPPSPQRKCPYHETQGDTSSSFPVQRHPTQKSLNELLYISPPASPSTPGGAARRTLPEPFQAEYHPRLYSSAHPTYKSTSWKKECSVPMNTRLSTPPLVRKFRRERMLREFKAKSFDKYKGTQEEIDEERDNVKCILGDSSKFDVEQYIADRISPYSGRVEVVEDIPTPVGLKGVLKTPSSAGRQKKRIFLMRKTIKVTIPREKRRGDILGKSLPQTYIYEPGEPQYNIGEGELLPPRHYTPSPDLPYSKKRRPRTPQQLQSRLALETDDHRRHICVKSREPDAEVKKQFGDIESKEYEMPGLYLRQKMRTPLGMTEAKRRKRAQQKCYPSKFTRFN